MNDGGILSLNKTFTKNNGINDTELFLLLTAYGFTPINSNNPHLEQYSYFKDENQSITQITSILHDDKKNNTYKIALLRSIAETSNSFNYENFQFKTINHEKRAIIPLGTLILEWVKYYWSLIDNDIHQSNSENGRLIFESELKDVINEYKKSNDINPFAEFEMDLKSANGLDKKSIKGKLIHKLLSKVKQGIKQPIKYAGNTDEQFFVYDNDYFNNIHKVNITLSSITNGYGSVTVPVGYVREMRIFGDIIKDSIILKWANQVEDYSKKFDNKKKSLGFILNNLTVDYKEERDQAFIHRQVEKMINSGQIINTIYTGKQLKSNSTYAIDHLLPYSVYYNNDLWNLVPADSKVNGSKSNKFIDTEFLTHCKGNLFNYWHLIQHQYNERFHIELENSLHIDTNKPNWEEKALIVIKNQLNFTANLRHLKRWKVTSK